MIKLVDRIEVMSDAVTLSRAREMTKIPVEYVLGAGGRNPNAADPRSTITRNGRELFGLDCSGAVCHAIGFDRYQPEFDQAGGWVNTDGIVRDARGPQEIFELIEYPTPGCVVVFPGIDYDSDGDRDRIGHVALVTGVPAEWDPENPQFGLLTIIDCAGSNSRLVPGAVGDVAEHDAGYFVGKHRYREKTNPRWGSILARVKYENLA